MEYIYIFLFSATVIGIYHLRNYYVQKTKSITNDLVLSFKQNDDYRLKIQNLEITINNKDIEILDLSTQLVKFKTLYAEKESYLKELNSDRENMVNEFKNYLSTDFRITAKEEAENINIQLFNRFETYLKTKNNESDTKISSFLEPIKNIMEDVKKQQNSISSEFKKDYGNLENLLEKVEEGQRLTAKEASKLSNALQGSTKISGSWGENQLKRLLDLSLLVENIDYETQYTLEDNSRPDVVIHLPDDNKIAIDSKVSIQKYLDAVNSTDIEIQNGLLKEHSKQIRSHMNSLSQKRYDQKLKNSLGIVIMFVPNEDIFSSAFKTDPKLFEDAHKNRILIVGPLNLLGLIAIFKQMKSLDNRAKQIQSISEIGEKLINHLENSAKYLNDLHGGIKKTIDGYNKFIGNVETRVKPQVKKLQSYYTNSSNTSWDKIELINESIKNIN